MVTADYDEFVVRVESPLGKASFGFDDFTKDSDHTPLKSAPLISHASSNPLVLLTVGTEYIHASALTAPSTMSAGGEYFLVQLEDHWPTPIAWRGSYVVKGSIEMTVETFA